MKDFKELATDESIKKTIDALKVNGIESVVAENEEEAKAKVLELLPKGAEIMNMTSVTLTTLGLDKEIMESEHYDAVKNKLLQMDRNTQSLQMQKLGTAPEYAIGSVNAITENGQVVFGSNTGSQLSAYVYGSAHVILVVGTQKIVKDLDTAIERIYEYVLPLEANRLNKQFNTDRGSYVSKLLIINKEIKPNRITIILVKKLLGF